jgi:uncharacterized membrane protein
MELWPEPPACPELIRGGMPGLRRRWSSKGQRPIGVDPHGPLVEELWRTTTPSSSSGATYDNSDVEVTDYEAVKELYREVKTSHDFDAAVVAKDPDGKVRIVKKHEQPTRHGAAVGLSWGPGHRVAAVLFPPVGIGIAAAGAAGAAIGGVAGNATGGMPRGDLKDLGEALDSGTASLIAVYETNLADQVAANIKAASRLIFKETDVDAEMKAEQSAPIPEQAGQPTGRPGAGSR